MPEICKGGCPPKHRLQFYAVIKRNPSGSGFQFTPALSRTDSCFFFNNCEYAFACIGSSLRIVRTCTGTNSKVCSINTNTIRYIWLTCSWLWGGARSSRTNRTIWSVLKINPSSTRFQLAPSVTYGCDSECAFSCLTYDSSVRCLCATGRKRKGRQNKRKLFRKYVWSQTVKKESLD